MPLDDGSDEFQPCGSYVLSKEQGASISLLGIEKSRLIMMDI